MKRCRYSGCRKKFEPKRSTLEVCCSPSCAIAYSREASPKRKERDSRRIHVAEKRDRREGLETARQLLARAQSVFNGMIRERDYFKPCISCGARIMTLKHGGVWDAGHYRTVGAAPELRFEPRNVHKQCKTCNSGVRRAGNRILVAHDAERAATIRAKYRVNLVERIGLDQVEWLEGPHPPLKPTADWLREQMTAWRLETKRMREARERRAVA